jgi:DNA-binding NarL/FixJ family response regulator
VCEVAVFAHNTWRAAEMKRLLLVEDHALFRESLALLLEWKTGLVSLEAGSLDEARRIVSDNEDEPVCIVIDLDLPNGDGMELLEHFRGLPLLALTTDRNPQCYAWASEAGADEVLSKAESAEKIVDAVRQLVDG